MSEKDDKLQKEALAYLESRPFLKDLLKRFLEKYRSLGRWGGKLRLCRLNELQRRELSAFLREPVGENIELQYQAFSAAWGNTRFSDMALPEMAEILWPRKTVSKKAEASQKEQAWRQEVLALYAVFSKDSLPCQWLDGILLGRFLWRAASHEEVQALQLVAKALSELPTGYRYERLPVFANRLCGQPHMLDDGTETGRLFLRALAYLCGAEVRTAEEKAELLYQYHLLKDDILNQVSVYGLRAWSVDYESGELIECRYWQEASKANAVLNVPLREIVRLEKFLPMESPDGSGRWPVYVVENAGVFSSLVDGMSAHGILKPLLCLHGQPKTASWALLDRLYASRAMFLYSGDYDPEGLGIADKVLQRYRGSKCWHMSVAEYGKSQENLVERRMQQLKSIKSAELQALSAAIIKRGTAFYQESLLKFMLDDLLREEFS